MKKHSKIDAKQMAAAVDMASELNQEAALDRKKRSENGDLSADLPPGHPLLVAIENARIRLETKEESDKEKKEFAKKKKSKRAKRAKQMEAEENLALEKQREESIDEFNNRLKQTADHIADFGKFIDDMKKTLPQINTSRLKRMLVATHQGLMRSQLQQKKQQ